MEAPDAFAAATLRHAEALLAPQPLQRGVLLLEFLESFRAVDFQPAVLVPPPVVPLLGHAELTTYRRDIRTISEQPVSLPEPTNHLLQRVTLPSVCHDLTSLPARSLEQQDNSHNDWTYKKGSGQYGHFKRRQDHRQWVTL